MIVVCDLYVESPNGWWQGQLIGKAPTDGSRWGNLLGVITQELYLKWDLLGRSDRKWSCYLECMDEPENGRLPLSVEFAALIGVNPYQIKWTWVDSRGYMEGGEDA